jgi:hypothetical protein
MTDRVGRWVTEQVGRLGRTVNEIAVELGCDWHTINDAVIAYGTALVDDPDRIGETTALGVDETLLARVGPWRTQRWSTSIVDVRAGQLLDVVEGRNATAPCAWLAERGTAWCDRIKVGTLDLSGPYRKVFDTMVPHALQVADPFHLVKLANSKLDERRRRVQNETLGHRGHKHDPLYRCRRPARRGPYGLARQGSRARDLHHRRPRTRRRFRRPARRRSPNSECPPEVPSSTAPSCAGPLRSARGTPPGCPTGRPKRRTT